jgi:hypothetical protein
MKRTTLAVIAALLMASTSFAATQNTGTNTIAPTLQVSATIQSAVQLTLSTGAAAGSCAVSGGTTTDYKMDFGNVDGLAINTPSCGSKYTPAQTGGNAVYYTEYRLTPSFTSQSTSNNTVTAYVSSNFSLANVSIVRDTANTAAVPAANGFSALSTNSGSPDTIASNAGSGSAQSRYIGVSVANSNGAGLTGATSATVTFTLTVN